MVAITELLELKDALELFGYPIPNWMIAILLMSIFTAILIKTFNYIIHQILNLAKAIETHFYNYERRQFIGIRNNFVDHLIYEVQRLNQKADWNDFLYTELEAEVEVDLSLNSEMGLWKNPFVSLNYFWKAFKKYMGISPSLKYQKNLIRAIMGSKSRSFLVIGDPGSGKTVSLRRLFLEMTKTCVSSKNKNAIVPIYLNLKHLDLEFEDVNADRIHEWVLEQLHSNQDRTIHEFLRDNFEQMLKRGSFFFLFDSFDEIPAVMDAQEEHKVVHQYAEALENFLNSQHKSRGLVSSRPYRAPKIFIGQKLTIRPLSIKRIKNAIDKYMGQEISLANQLWQQLTQSREDLMHVAQNPFYLGLLSRYAKDNKKLPDRHFDLFEHFVQTRTNTDKERLSHLGFIPAELIEQASILAFAMTQESVGLEVNVDKIQDILCNLNKQLKTKPNKIEPLLHSLAYSKLGQITQGEPGTPNEFSFVHRRFHEYFCARFLKLNPHIAPFENLVNDDRWREVLVLLCEVLPGDHLTEIFDTTRSTLQLGITADSGTVEHKKAIETIRFLRDGFRSRIGDLPDDIRAMCTDFIAKQFKSRNLLDQKRALEGLSLVDKESVNSIFELALINDSYWLKETAIKSCRILPSIPEQISKEMRKYFHHQYLSLKNIRSYSTYSTLFSFSQVLYPLKSFIRILLFATVFQILLYTFIFLYAFFANIELFMAYLVGLVVSIFLFTYMPHIIPFNHVGSTTVIKKSRPALFKFRLRESLKIIDSFWYILPIILIYFNFAYYVEINQDSSVTFNVIRLLILLLIFNVVFLNNLVSYYPHNISDLISHIISNTKFYLMNVFKNFKLSVLIAFILLSVSLGSVALIKWAIFVFEIGINYNYSLATIFLNYGIILATFIVSTLLVEFLLFVIFITISSAITFVIIMNLIKIILDQWKLKKLSLSLQNIPLTTNEIIYVLNSFKSDMGKVQFIDGLFKWLPVGTDPQVLIDEANKHHGNISEKLYQLAEVWEDSMQES